MKACPTTLCALAASVCVHSAVFDLDVMPKTTAAEPNLIEFNALAGGSPIPNASGISLNTIDATLFLNFVWGDLNGLKDLKSSFTGAVLQTVATPNTPAQVVYNLTPVVVQQTPTDGGIFSYTLHLTDVGSYTVAQQSQDLLQSHWFINVQSSASPSGEIRSQLTPVPEPAEYAWVAGLGLMGLAVCRRNLRRT